MRTSFVCPLVLFFTACTQGGLPIEGSCNADLAGVADQGSVPDLTSPPTPLPGTYSLYVTNGLIDDVRDMLGGASALPDVLTVAEGFGFDNLYLKVPFVLGYPWTRLGEDVVMVNGQSARTFDLDLSAGGDAIWDKLGAGREHSTAEGPVRQTKTARITCIRPPSATAAGCTVHGVLSATVN